MNKTLVVMGNGQSLKNVDLSIFDDCDTFGLNCAYRNYERINWYPTYHGSFDYLGVDAHKDELNKLIDSKKIQRHFYIRNISTSSRFTFINLLRFGCKKINLTEEDFTAFCDTGSSGTNACSVGICLGYKKIVLIGVDCNYVEVVHEAKQYGGTLVLEKTPETNPNYWFDDYHQKGDPYNLPRCQEFLIPTWERFAFIAQKLGVEIINASPISVLKNYKKMSLEEAIK